MSPSRYLIEDHRHLDELLNRAVTETEIDEEAYNTFRRGLLRHIAIEENIVMPLIRERSENGFFALQQIHLEHGAIAALMVPPPTEELIAVLRALLDRHNLLEETQDTLYDVLDHCARTDQPELLSRLKDHPEVPLSPNINNPAGLEPARRAIVRAGYSWEKLLEAGRG
ncbi:MAG: hemerythrin domain-containing protein [Bacteroidetes bacterium]|nr:hemerythrin domain-containing protein [Bacteroidota bacterium]